MKDNASSDQWLRLGHAGDAGDRIGNIAREYRIACGRSQVEVAVAAEMTQQALSQIETGARRATIEQREKLAKVLGVPLQELGLAGHAGKSPTIEVGDVDVATSRGRWRACRNWLNRRRFELAHLAAELYPTESRVERTSLITQPSWMPEEPLDLGSLRLSLDERPQTTELTGREPASSPVRPLRTSGSRFDSYTSAIKHLDAPQLSESRPSYRLLGGCLRQRELRFGLATYFDKLDVSEALGHELALSCEGATQLDTVRIEGNLPFRELVGDPFDPDRRAIVPAITTLTVRLRRYPADPSFLLHWRDPTCVATAAGMYDVIPAGEFQPSSVALWDRGNDFSLWRNMVREYSEELLGAPEHDGSRSEPIDYQRWSLFQTLDSARQEGRISAAVLGMGLDALTLAATILTVVVIDDDVFETAFVSTIRVNDEGEIVAVGDGRAADGVPFTESAINRLLTSEPLAAPGAACLALAWRHRHSLMS